MSWDLCERYGHECRQIEMHEAAYAARTKVHTDRITELERELAAMTSDREARLADIQRLRVEIDEANMHVELNTKERDEFLVKYIGVYSDKHKIIAGIKRSMERIAKLRDSQRKTTNDSVCYDEANMIISEETGIEVKP